MTKTFSSITVRRIQEALLEDLGAGDLTSELLVPASVRISAKVIAKQDGFFCGIQVVAALCRFIHPSVQPVFHIKDGQAFTQGKTLVELKGPANSILAIERTLLNLIAHLSGVTTLTQSLVKKVQEYNVSILDTRKTTPLWRELEKYAVRMGGGKNHRFGLYDEIFVKENHKGYGSLIALQKYARKFVIEVRNYRELIEALALKPRVILFDNFSPTQLKKAAALAKTMEPRVILEASGGIHAGNIQKYARTGIHQISLGCLTHSVAALDFSLLVSSSKKT